MISIAQDRFDRLATENAEAFYQKIPPEPVKEDIIAASEPEEKLEEGVSEAADTSTAAEAEAEE
jgi:hypothetical protein